MNSLFWSKSVSIKGSLIFSCSDKLIFYKYFTLLNNKSIKSQNGNKPVPPQTITILPSSYNSSNFSPAPIGLESKRSLE